MYLFKGIESKEWQWCVREGVQRLKTSLEDIDPQNVALRIATDESLCEDLLITIDLTSYYSTDGLLLSTSFFFFQFSKRCERFVQLGQGGSADVCEKIRH
jgi:hypothetical protein